MLKESDTLIRIILSFRICCTKDDGPGTKSCYKTSLEPSKILLAVKFKKGALWALLQTRTIVMTFKRMLNEQIEKTKSKIKR